MVSSNIHRRPIVNKPLFYYVTPTESEYWILHRRSCVRLSEAKGKLFLGTLYNHHQALAIAHIRVGQTRTCGMCMDKPAEER